MITLSIKEEEGLFKVLASKDFGSTIKVKILSVKETRNDAELLILKLLQTNKTFTAETL